MDFRVLKTVSVLVSAIILSGCSQHPQPYQEQWSKAKNLANAAGMTTRIHDQQLPSSAYNQQGKLREHKLNNISHPAYGSGSGVSGVNINPYGPFEHFYWGWTIPGASHHSEHRLFAWMPFQMAKDPHAARVMLETLLIRSSLAILSEMDYDYQPINMPFEHEGRTFKQWYLGKDTGSCSLDTMNCVLSLYVPDPIGPYEAPNYTYHSIAGVDSWFFDAGNESTYPRLILAQGDGMKSISESVFYQKLSARLPGWLYFYMAPNEVGTGENNRTVAYPYLLEKGNPLLFIRPVK